MKEYNMPV